MSLLGSQIDTEISSPHLLPKIPNISREAELMTFIGFVSCLFLPLYNSSHLFCSPSTLLGIPTSALATHPAHTVIISPPSHQVAFPVQLYHWLKVLCLNLLQGVLLCDASACPACTEIGNRRAHIFPCPSVFLRTLFQFSPFSLFLIP